MWPPLSQIFIADFSIFQSDSQIFPSIIESYKPCCYHSQNQTTSLKNQIKVAKVIWTDFLEFGRICNRHPINKLLTSIKCVGSFIFEHALSPLPLSRILYSYFYSRERARSPKWSTCVSMLSRTWWSLNKRRPALANGHGFLIPNVPICMQVSKSDWKQTVGT